jgi:hypothetical protein
MLFPQPPNEAERLAALYSLAILDTPSTPAIDRICRIAQQLFDVPMVHVTLADAHRYFLKAKPEGVRVSELPREHAFCNYTILHDEVFVVPDARADRTVAKNPYVWGPPHIRFYAGAPLTIRPGIRLGALCVSDLKPWEFSQHQMTLLRSLGRLVVDELWLHHLEDSGQADMQPLPSDTREPSLDFDTWIAPTGAQIRAARELLNWSTRELADAANISPTSVKRVEIHGETSVRRDSLEAIVLAFREQGVNFTRAPDGTLGVTQTSSGLSVPVSDEARDHSSSR